MSRLDIRFNVDLPVNISLDNNGGATTVEKARFSNLSLGGGLIESGKAPPFKGVVNMKCGLPEYGKIEVFGEVLRVDEKGIAIRFLNHRKEEKIKLWSYLKDHVSDISTCPYCRSENIKKLSKCDACGLRLDFESPRYLSKHEKWSFLKRLAMKSEFFSADDILRIHNFVDNDILGIRRHRESDRADSGTGMTFNGLGSSVLSDDLSGISSLKEAKGIIEKQKLIEALKSQNNNISKVAKVLEVSRPSVYSMKKKYGV
jgi:hypothetical protein